MKTTYFLPMLIPTYPNPIQNNARQSITHKKKVKRLLVPKEANRDNTPPNLGRRYGWYQK